ncbi:MAG: YgfZ/GcvT domain-containing protein [Phycisphaerae bacterium]
MTLHDANTLLALHHEAEAETQPYADTEIVTTFGEPQAEYAAVRKACGLVDLPQRGFIELAGKDRHAFLNNHLTNATVSRETGEPMAAGQVVYSYYLNLKGRVVAEMNVIELGETTLIETDARVAPKLVQTWDLYLFAEKVKLADATRLKHAVALHGPGAGELLKSAGFSRELSPAAAAVGHVLGVPATVFRDDVCGVPGYELIVAAEEAAGLWRGLLEGFGELHEHGRRRLRPVGWAAYNACRIEAGRALFGVDFDGTEPSRPGPKPPAGDQPAEAAHAPGVLPAELPDFERAVSVTKGCYLGQEVVARMHARGNKVARKLVPFRMQAEVLPVAGVNVLDKEHNAVGIVTSSTISPVLSNACIGLAWVKRPHYDAGNTVTIPAEGSMQEATIVQGPFLNKDA